jgi:phage tail P2-like protein
MMQVVNERCGALDPSWPEKVRSAVTCPANMLGHLGWSRGLDYWEPGWPEAVKRELVRTTPQRLRQRGTLSAIYAAIAGFGGDVRIVEWWVDPVTGTLRNPLGPAMTAEAIISVGAAISQDGNVQDQLLRVLEREGRKSLHWDLFLEAGGGSAIAVESYMRAHVLVQHSGVQVG